MRGHPERLYLFTGAAQGFIFSWGLAAVVWWVVELELSPLRLVLLGTALEVTVLLAEVPTGVVADLYSRKWSMCTSYAVMGAAMMLAPITPVFWVLLVWQVLWSIGWTFQSGADTAWVTDETDGPVDALIVRHAVWRSVGILIGLAFVAAIGSWSLEGAMVAVGAVSVAIALYLAVVMHEHGFTPAETSDRGRWADAIDTWRSGARVVRGSRMLKVIVGAMVLMGAADEAIDRLDMLRLVQLGLPDFGGADAVVFFGVVWAAMTVLNIPVMLWLGSRLESTSDRNGARLMQLLLVLCSIGILALAVTPLFALAVAGWTTRDVAREVIEPLGVGLTNRHAESHVRATVISFRGQAEAVGQVMGGVALGTLAELTTVPIALTGSAILLLLAAAPYVSAARHQSAVSGDAQTERPRNAAS
jgi:MFS transporter, DHA3 family, tetracycline resistance protein